MSCVSVRKIGPKSGKPGSRRGARVRPPGLSLGCIRLQTASFVTFRLTFPIRPHLKQYLRFKEGAVDPLDLSRESVYGLLIWSQLQRPEWGDARIELPESVYTDALTLELTKRMSQARRFTVTVEGVHAINRALDELFNEHFFTHVDVLAEAGTPKKDAYYRWMDTVGLEEEHISFETLKKRHDRYRKAMARGRDTRKGHGGVLSLAELNR